MSRYSFGDPFGSDPDQSFDHEGEGDAGQGPPACKCGCAATGCICARLNCFFNKDKRVIYLSNLI